MLLEDLAGIAREAGFRRLVAETLPDNVGMQRVFRDAGLVHRRWFEDGVVRVELDLTAEDLLQDHADLRDWRGAVRSLQPILHPRHVVVFGAGEDVASPGRRVLDPPAAPRSQGGVSACRLPPSIGDSATLASPTSPSRLAVIPAPPQSPTPSSGAAPRACELPWSCLPGSPRREPPGRRHAGAGARGCAASRDAPRRAELSRRRLHSVRSQRHVTRPTLPPGRDRHRLAVGWRRHRHRRRGGAARCRHLVVRVDGQQGRRQRQRPAAPVGRRRRRPASCCCTSSRSAIRCASPASPGRCRVASRWSRSRAAGRRRRPPRRPLAHGGMAGDAGAVEALFAHTGVIRARTMEELIDVGLLLDRQPTPAGRRVALVGNAGGPLILGADAANEAERHRHLSRRPRRRRVVGRSRRRRADDRRVGGGRRVRRRLRRARRSPRRGDRAPARQPRQRGPVGRVGDRWRRRTDGAAVADVPDPGASGHGVGAAPQAVPRGWRTPPSSRP